MSKNITLALMLAVVAGLSACAQKNEEVVYADPAPITAEPTYTGKYK